VQYTKKSERKKAMFTLDAEFENSDGKSQHLRIKHFDPTKTGEEIKASLTKLTKLNLFEKKGVGLFKKVKHATLIETIETELFNKTLDEGSETAQLEKEGTQLTDIAEESPQTVDFVVREERLEPGMLIQQIELPEEIDPREMTQEQALSLISACMPDTYTLENIQIEDEEKPARIILTEKLKEKNVSSTHIQQTLPAAPSRKRKRLLERIRKRE